MLELIGSLDIFTLESVAENGKHILTLAPSV